MHIDGLKEPIHQARLAALEALRQAGVRTYLLKLVGDGLSFLIWEEEQTQGLAALKGYQTVATENCAVIDVFAVNMRDEAGLMARAIGAALASGAPLEHVGDMHDRLLIAARGDVAEVIAGAIRAEFGLGGAA